MQLVMRLSEDAVRRSQDLEADSLAEMLVQKGHTVTVRTALGGGGGCECLRNLRHVFLSVRIQVLPCDLVYGDVLEQRMSDASAVHWIKPSYADQLTPDKGASSRRRDVGALAPS